ncbi:precorrin-3B synthase [Epibacterium sp. SM1979]|uniref:Precorrin-3B synthase n=1 Tax=Tritonibacter litoralis TaxID=2662264 RepID=A0A843YC09_9RHOB|nr:precorrin-3B synthase [Tritonibacter litoralis]MQQ08840.1 precorrin-3B synthase [Tritonibacter litoralis]
MSAPHVYGWCPGALRPMMSGDGLVVRIRPPLGQLSQEQAHKLAELSLTYGNGRMDVSSRANLQLRGITPEAHPTVIAALRELDLVDETAAQESLRNVILTPFWSEGDATHHIAQSLTHALTQAKDLSLPGKFGFAVDAGPEPVLGATAADIRIEQGNAGLLLVADGADVGKPMTVGTAAQDAIALARWFLDQGGAPDGRGRMHRLTARRALPPEFAAPRRASAPLPSPGLTPAGQLVALEFGQIPATSFQALADIAPLRLTPWRQLLVKTQQPIPPLPGLILDATDPRLQVIACTGAPGCLQARAQTRALARNLAPLLPQGTQLHISGCAKGCARNTPCDLTLVAQENDTFDLILQGTAQDAPRHTGLSAATLPDALVSLFQKGQTNAPHL